MDGYYINTDEERSSSSSFTPSGFQTSHLWRVRFPRDWREFCKSILSHHKASGKCRLRVCSFVGPEVLDQLHKICKIYNPRKHIFRKWCRIYNHNPRKHIFRKCARFIILGSTYLEIYIPRSFYKI